MDICVRTNDDKVKFVSIAANTIPYIREIMKMDPEEKVYDVPVSSTSLEYAITTIDYATIIPHPFHKVKQVLQIPKKYLDPLEKMVWSELRSVLLDVLKLYGDEKSNTYEILCAYIAARYMVCKTMEKDLHCNTIRQNEIPALL